jgi:3-phosphoshikimate 1-carboxyvinyltransferase
MKVKLMPRWLSGSLSAPQSKSHLHRLLIANALSGSNQKIKLGQISDDIAATIECLNSLITEESPTLYCNESGSTLRFLLPVTMALKKKASFHGKGRLLERPLDPLKDALSGGGCIFSNIEKSMFTVEGILKSGNYSLPGNVSSQYVTGLLFALPLVQGESRILVSKPLESSGYIDMTLQVLKLYNVEILVDKLSDEKHVIFTVPGDQKYIAPPEAPNVEGDWSNSSFWLAAGALSRQGDGIHNYGLNQTSAQGDREIIDLLKNFGANVILSKNDIFTSGNNLYGITIDASNIPDLVPILAVLASVSHGTTRITNADRVRTKECDRLHAITESLNAVGGIVTELEDGLIINGVNFLTGGAVSSFNDHRIVMAMAIASCCCEGEIIIDGVEAVNKSYPTFFDDFIIVGGRYSYL